MSDLVDRFIQRYGRLPTERDPDYLEMLRMTKYRFLDVPQMKPGKCSNCGSSKVDGRKYLDFGLEVDWYGIVYICSLCLLDITNNIGLFVPYNEEIKKLQREVIALRALNDRGQELQNVVLHTFEEVKNHFVDVQSPSNYTDADINPSMEPDKAATNSSGTFKTESGVTKSTPSSRRSDVPSLAKLLEAGD